MNDNDILTVKNQPPKKKKKGKFNIIDLFIVVIIISVIAFLVYIFTPWSGIKRLFNSNNVTLQYAVEIKNVDSDFIELIKEGDTVMTIDSKKDLGNVSRIETTGSMFLTYREDDGAYSGVLSNDPNKFDLTVYVSANAEYEKGIGYTVNGNRIAIGETLKLRFPEYSCEGQCVVIDPNS